MNQKTRLFSFIGGIVFMVGAVKVAVLETHVNSSNVAISLKSSVSVAMPPPQQKIIPLVTFDESSPGSAMRSRNSSITVPLQFGDSNSTSVSPAGTGSSLSPGAPTNYSLRAASPTKVAPVTLSLARGTDKLLSTPSAPPLEQQRFKEERDMLSAGKSDGNIELSSGFECGTPIEARRISPNYFVIKIPSRRFLFRINGVAGKLIRIDLEHSGSTESVAGRTNPLFTYATDLSAAETYNGNYSGHTFAPTTAWNGASLPATDDQSWHYFYSVWNSQPGIISIVQRFDRDQAYIAMRVPRPPSYNERYFKSLAENGHVCVVNVGNSVDGRKLLLAKISNGEEAERQQPCILMYGGEHADEPDSMWATQGAIDFLISNSPEAKQLRDNFTFLIIPNEDPDASAEGLHEHLTGRFMTKTKTPDNTLYADWFEAWVNKQNRLDLALDFHCGGFEQPADVACALIEGVGNRGKISFAINQAILQQIEIRGFTANPRPWMRGWSPDRLGGWMTRRFGTFTLAYEFDSQSSIRHMNIRQLENCGVSILRAATTFLKTPQQWMGVKNEIDSRRNIRLARIKAFRAELKDENAIDFEAKLGLSDSQEAEFVSKENWVQ